MNLADKTVLVAGAGLSGISAVTFLHKLNANIILYDGNDKLNKKDIVDKLSEGVCVEIILGELPSDVITRVELMVISPGIPMDLDFVKRIEKQNIPIWGEVELAYGYIRGKIVAITGTNGKTTTTALTGAIMRSYYESVFVAGNIGTPITDIAWNTGENSITVAELSSFQLETIHSFKPYVSAILNITPDHLNRHKTMENYIEAKMRISSNQDKEQVCVLNYDDEIIKELSKDIKCKILYFSRLHKLDYGIYLDGEDIVYKNIEDKTIICNIKELKLPGVHSIENVMAATGMAICLGIPDEKITDTVTSFMGVEHRIEYVTERRNVIYYNDSKGTNTDAAIKGIEAMTRPTILIGGGYNKETKFDDWIKAFNGKVKYLILIGETKDIIEATAKRNGFYNILKVNSLEEAVIKASELADINDAVLLSPACASWDMFSNFEERGNKFKEYIHNLGE